VSFAGANGDSTSPTEAAPGELALADGEGVALAEVVSDLVAEAVADTDASADGDAVGIAELVAPAAGFFVACFVGCLVGVGLGDGRGFVGATDGERWPEVACHAKATNPPFATLSPSTLTVEYTHRPEVPSDQNRPQ